jgi:hypothetical protein
MKSKTVTLVLLAVLGILSFSTLATEYTLQVTHADVFTHPSQGDVTQVEGAEAILYTTAEGAAMSFHTNNLEDNHVYTAWFVIINNPSACANTPCTAGDVLTDSDKVEAEVVQADSILLSSTAPMQFSGFVAVGDVESDNAWFGNGFTNPNGAEIHIIINDHGPLVDGMAATMLSSYRGGCQDEGLPSAFPETAISDGEAGPNTCRLIQYAIFQQAND